MGVGISMGGLAGAVAKEGAAGIISNAQIGFREADLKKIRFRPTCGPWKVNTKRPERPRRTE